MSKTCQSCGNPLPADASFCAVCGKSQPPAAKPPHKRNKGLMIALLCVGVAALLAVFVLILLLLKGNDTPARVSTEPSASTTLSATESRNGTESESSANKESIPSSRAESLAQPIESKTEFETQHPKQLDVSEFTSKVQGYWADLQSAQALDNNSAAFPCVEFKENYYNDYYVPGSAMAPGSIIAVKQTDSLVYDVTIFMPADETMDGSREEYTGNVMIELSADGQKLIFHTEEGSITYTYMGNQFDGIQERVYELVERFV